MALGSLGRVVLRAAERVEESLGPAMGLRSYRALLVQKDPEVRIAAVRGALRCMSAIGRFDDVDDVVAAWEKGRDLAVGPAEMAGHCRRLLHRGQGAVARRLAEAEVVRSGSARAWYLVARVRQAVNDEGAADAFRRAIAAAAPEATDVTVSARAALLEQALAEGEGEAPTEGLEEGNDDQRLLAAAAALRSSSKFRRASGASLLAELATGPRGREAVAMAAEHADRMGLDLSWVEAERLEAVIVRAGWLESGKAERALRRLRARRRLAASAERETELSAWLAEEQGGARHLDLARAVARGDEVDPDELELAAGVPAAAAHALVVVDALRRDDAAVAARGLLALIDDVPKAGIAGAWTAARLALADARHRERAARLVRKMLDGSWRPVRGWLPLVTALRGAGEESLADEVLMRACAMGEEGAVDERVTQLVKQGWAAYERGERDAAISLLEEAKALHAGSAR
ncbi:MAG TPA: hypothetical protein ENK57_15935 [Polyangiaceae bacterium]|nr:hypothetical protein [Polyangiaceae bacterium]